MRENCQKCVHKPICDLWAEAEGMDAFNYCDNNGSECIHVAQSGWISVEDDLPKRSKNNFEEYIVRVTRSHWPTSSYDPVDAPYDEEFTTSACYDFDQKVWHLGRSEVVLNALLKPEDAPLNGEVVTHWMPMPEPPEGKHDGLE